MPRSTELVVPALVVGSVRHQRRTPVRHTVAMRTHLWLVDLDRLDELPARVRRGFRAADHFAGTAESIRDGLLDFLATRDRVVPQGHQLIMLAAPRLLGHVFNPLSVHWCLAPDGRVSFAVLEIHNTYGERHAHVIELDERREALVDKEFYVSPFFAVDGRYRVRLDLRAERVSVSIVLERGGEVAFAAAFRGIPQRPTRSARLRAALRTPLSTQQTSARIRWHGIRLWARLPVHPRPRHTPPWANPDEE
jgi:DUF1365 family protein